MEELYRLKKVDLEFYDERGSLVQLVHKGYAQVNILFSKAGVKRGDHYHKQSTEAFYVVSGEVHVEFAKVGNAQLQTMADFKKGDFFEIPPYTLHNMLFYEDCYLIGFYDQAVEQADGTKDIIQCNGRVQ